MSANASEIWRCLKGVSLNVDAGEVVCLLGASGSGKTTLLRCINHLETIDEGEIRVAGELVGYARGPDGKLQRGKGQDHLGQARPHRHGFSALQPFRAT